jgi:hypothetical protein
MAEVKRELDWIKKRTADLIWRGMSRDDARRQAVAEQSEMEELGLDDPADKRA